MQVMAKAVNSLISKYGLRLVDLVIGLKYAIAVVEGRCGEAAGLCYVDYLDTLFEPPVPSSERLEELLTSEYHLWRVAGVAISNAVFQYVLWNEQGIDRFPQVYSGREESLRKLLELLKGKSPTLVVGNMGPLIRVLNDHGIETIVLERCLMMRVRSLADTSLPFVARKARSLVATGATIPNGTIDFVIKCLRHTEPRILAGPTAQLHPDVAKVLGITALASTRVTNISRAIDIVKRGGGRHDLREVLCDYVIVIDNRDLSNGDSAKCM